jgi:hypothetical protein
MEYFNDKDIKKLISSKYLSSLKDSINPEIVALGFFSGEISEIRLSGRAVFQLFVVVIFFLITFGLVIHG